ncbi:MAG: response regulator, partial [Limisphaerales bacterium]
ITRTESQSSLDDSAAASFQEQKQLYALIDGNVPISQIIQSSPLSRPSTMASLAKWFSLEDITIPKTHAESPCRVLVVDDSPLMCRALQTIFAEDPRIELAGIAHDGVEALRLIEEYNPDVLTLDLQMPKMDGLTALKHIMIRNPKPVVVVSAFTQETSRLTYEAFRYGAVDVMAKPSGKDKAVREKGAQELRDRVAQAACVRIEAAQYIRRRPNAAGASSRSNGNASGGEGADFLIVVSDAGGFPLLLKVFFALSGMHEAPSVVCSTGLSAGAVQALVPCLAADCGLAITPFRPPGGVLAPRTSIVGSRQHPFRPVEANGGIAVETVKGNGSVRSFDALLSGAADLLGKRAVALLISGEGDDGLDGMRRIREVGGRAFALSPEMCLKQDLPRKILVEGYAVELKTVSAIVDELAACPQESCGATARNERCESLAVRAP